MTSEDKPTPNSGCDWMTDESALTHDQLRAMTREACEAELVALEQVRALQLANDELFKIKQKTVIANRELMRQNEELRQQLKNARDALRALADTDYAGTHASGKTPP